MHPINNYQHAIKFIQSHGHFATLTPDGVLALAHSVILPATDTEEGTKAFLGMCKERGFDYSFEEPQVFPVDHDGNVKAREVREWLGY